MSSDSVVEDCPGSGIMALQHVSDRSRHVDSNDLKQAALAQENYLNKIDRHNLSTVVDFPQKKGPAY